MAAGTSAEVDIQRCARELLPRSAALAATISEQILQTIPAVAPPETPDATRGVYESTEQNVGAILATLGYGLAPEAIEPPTATQELLRRLLDAGGDLTDLLRAYHLGQELLRRLWTEHLRAELRDVERLHDALDLSTRQLYAFVDRACQRLVETHRATVLGRSTFSSPDQAELVQALLGSGSVDLDATTVGLRYDVRAYHIAVVASPRARSQHASTRRTLERLFEATNSAALVVPAGGGVWWAWLGWRVQPTEDQLGTIAAMALPDVVVGMGEPGRGRAGFRRSHEQALRAYGAAGLARPRPRGVVRHRDIELAALLCADRELAERLVEDRLGPLAASDSTARRLRTTARAYLTNGRSHSRTATALRVHEKTVSYRLDQIERLLGRSLATDTLEIEAALLIDHSLRADDEMEPAAP